MNAHYLMTTARFYVQWPPGVQTPVMRTRERANDGSGQHGAQQKAQWDLQLG